MTSRSQPRSKLKTKHDVTKLSALFPEDNSGQVGISGAQTVKFKNELERKISIKLDRLTDSQIRRITEERTYIEKIKRGKRISLSEKKKKTKTDEFIIEKIEHITLVFGQQMLFIKWKGWDDSENTWEPIENLDNCPDILKEFVDNEELKHFNKMEKLKEEISFGDLLSEKNLVGRIGEVEESDLTKLKVCLILKLLTMINLPECEELHVSDLVQEARNTLQLYETTRRRCRQMMAIKDWEVLLNKVDESKKLSVENDVDFAGPPENFNYINESIPGAGVTVPNEPPIGCECVVCNCRANTCGDTHAGPFPYTADSRLRLASGIPIYECNKACKCSSECINRVVQKGRNVKLTIFRTSNGCGWGVRAEQKIKQGQFVCQYVGEIITFEEAKRREREYDATGLTYLFDLDFNSYINPSYVIDACNWGNVSHFINHSCDPNLRVWAVWGDCLDPNLPMLAFFATRDIEVGEEICIDYKQCNVNDEKLKTAVSTDIVEDENACASSASEAKKTTSAASSIKCQNITSLKNRTECKCGTIKCRKYVF